MYEFRSAVGIQLSIERAEGEDGRGRDHGVGGCASLEGTGGENETGF
jgi:hypothetical protein